MTKNNIKFATKVLITYGVLLIGLIITEPWSNELSNTSILLTKGFATLSGAYVIAIFVFWKQYNDRNKDRKEIDVYDNLIE